MKVFFFGLPGRKFSCLFSVAIFVPLVSRSRGAAMGMMLGKITVETPKYQMIEKKEEFEIREYEPSVVAEVTYDPKEMKRGRDGGFMILAGYIGALGSPCNKKKGTEAAGEKIAMTAPVITQEQSQGEQKVKTSRPSFLCLTPR